MSESPLYFQFKQFSLRHDRSVHKVGTDGVLLGAWASITSAKDILDIGTGSALIALMLAQRTAAEVRIDAVEVDADSAVEAKENVSKSPWKDKIKVFETSIQEFSPGKQYDLIISNPPYFLNSLHSPSSRRTAVRHAVTLSFEELLASVERLMRPEGKFCIILPTAEGDRFADMATHRRWHCRRRLAFFSRMQKPQERWLFEWQLIQGNLKQETLVLYDEEMGQSTAYHQLTEAFYLNR